jgi:hypothetical protein
MPPDPFQPTWPRAALVLAAAAVGFALPQGVPLEYASPDHPSSGLQYLEIACAADFTGQVMVSLDTGRGFNLMETIRWPMSPSRTPCTYAFPLPDAPIYRMRLSYVKSSGELTIARFRIINRRGEETYRVAADDFFPAWHVAAVTAVPPGWRMVSIPNAGDPYCEITLRRTLLAEGMNGRNLGRCLLSWGYLSLMIWILALAAYLALRPPAGVSDFAPAFVFLGFVAILFSAVGNRGLIRNSIRYARVAQAQAVPAARAPSPR